MKIRWTLKGMDKVKNKHLEANAAYWKYDLLLNAQKVLSRIKDSKSLKFLGKGSNQLKNMTFLVENKANIATEDIDRLVDFKVEPKNKMVSEFTIFVSETYFSEHDMLEQVAGRMTRRYLARKKIGRQEMIDNFEKEIRKLYTKDFVGEVLESEGHNLSVMK